MPPEATSILELLAVAAAGTLLFALGFGFIALFINTLFGDSKTDLKKEIEQLKSQLRRYKGYADEAQSSLNKECRAHDECKERLHGRDSLVAAANSELIRLKNENHKLSSDLSERAQHDPVP